MSQTRLVRFAKNAYRQGPLLADLSIKKLPFLIMTDFSSLTMVTITAERSSRHCTKAPNGMA
jgi:hypothetical protein